MPENSVLQPHPDPELIKLYQDFMAVSGQAMKLRGLQGIKISTRLVGDREAKSFTALDNAKRHGVDVILAMDAQKSDEEKALIGSYQRTERYIDQYTHREDTMGQWALYGIGYPERLEPHISRMFNRGRNSGYYQKFEHVPDLFAPNGEVVEYALCIYV